MLIWVQLLSEIIYLCVTVDTFTEEYIELAYFEQLHCGHIISNIFLFHRFVWPNEPISFTKKNEPNR